MKKRNWAPIKEMVIAYLAISKMLYWMSIIPVASDLGGIAHAILERLLQRDIVLIIVIVFIYFFERAFIMKQDKWSGIAGQIWLAIGGYGIFSIILIAYQRTFAWILAIPFDVGLFISEFMLGWTVVFFIIMGVLTVKEHFKKKEALQYAVDVQSTEIKLEMLKALLEDEVLSREEFDRQRVKVLEV